MSAYRTTHVEKLADKDSFAHGCEAQPRCILCEPITLTADTFPDLVRKAKQWAGGMDETTYVFMPDGVASSHFGFNQLECGDSTEPGADDLAAWKKGKLDLWLCDFTFAFEVVQETALTPADLIGLTGDL